MRAFDSDLFNYKLLSLVERKGPLTANEIIKVLAEEYKLTQEEQEELEPNKKQTKFYCFVHKRLNKKKYFKNLKNEQKWQVTKEGKKRLDSFYDIIDKDSLLKIISKNTNLIDCELQFVKKKKDYLICEKKEFIVVITVEKKPNRIYDYIDSTRKEFDNKTIRGIIIKPFDKEMESRYSAQNNNLSKSSEQIRTMYCKVMFSVQHDNNCDTPNQVLLENNFKIPEWKISNYFEKHLSNIEDELKPYEKCREFPIDDNHNIDLLCKDGSNRFVVIENKTIVDKNLHIYDAVGQTLCYLGLLAQQYNEIPRGILLVPECTSDSNKQDLYATLRFCDKIKLLFYQTTLSLVDD